MKRLKNIQKFLKFKIKKIRRKIKKERKNNKVVCKQCKSSDFEIESGQYYCTNCAMRLGPVFGYDKTDYERIFFSKKSIYQRKYHYKNKIEQIGKKFKLNLRESEKNSLNDNLKDINGKKLERINKIFKRKRIINVDFIIREMLKMMNKK